MIRENRIRGKDIIGKTVVSDEGSKFGKVADLTFISETGELLNIVLTEPTKATKELHLNQDESGNYLIPFASVKSICDFVIVSEKELF